MACGRGEEIGLSQIVATHSLVIGGRPRGGYTRSSFILGDRKRRKIGVQTQMSVLVRSATDIREIYFGIVAFQNLCVQVKKFPCFVLNDV